jgi:internalin A
MARRRSGEDGWNEALRRIEKAQQAGRKKLDLSDLGLYSVPDSLAGLAELESLNLSNNKIEEIPDLLAEFANLKALFLIGCQISRIPDWIDRLTSLESLFLSINQIAKIPDSLGELINLRWLEMYINEVTAIPDCIGELAELRDLDLSSNNIKVIPPSLTRLTNLESLDLASNKISRIPDSLAQLASLEHLDVSDNKIRSIPELGPRLEDLNVAKNQIASLPDSIGKLKHLKYLDLSNNRITTIPESMTGLKRLARLFLHGNPGLGIPDEILGPDSQKTFVDNPVKPKPSKAILAYYFGQRSPSRPLNEAKLILVGQGGVGKTSLVKALTTGKFDRREETTEGIRITHWPCTISRGDAVTLHIWDFGGQEIMHATHQFFLTARSLYLLVMNRRPGGYDREADYWFRLIRAFGGKDAPVVVVLNKQQSEPFDVNRGAWLERYRENIRGFVETDCSDPASIALLKCTIGEQVVRIKDVRTNFPRRWFAIKEELSAMPADYVDFAQYREICRKHGETDPEQQTMLAGFLHDLGIALNYWEDPRLRFAYVLKPEWVTEGIYALLHAFVKQNGSFARSQAEQVLKSKGYPAEAGAFLTGLMEQFEISFPLGDRQNRMLIPELLEDRQPEAARDFDPARCLNFGYAYSVIPEGLLPRFIVRTHHLSRPDSRWKSGVILYDAGTGCRGLVRTDPTENQVRIHIDGPEALRSELLAAIRHNFEAIHSDYEFHPMDLVYAPGAPDRALRVDELEALQRSGDSTVRVVRSDQTVIQPEIAALVAPIQSPPPVKLFLSYSHSEEKHIDELRKDLKLMERNGLLRTWYDRALTAGEKWEARILAELNDADVIVCQLSRDFLASDFCALTELAAAIRRKEAGEAVLIAYVLKDCGWNEVPHLRQFQLIPKGAKPLIDWKDKNKYWRAVAESIGAAVKTLQDHRPPRPVAARSGRA